MLFKKKRETVKADWLIAGLGNPGSEYEETRHNAGFRALDAVSEELHASYWKSEDGALSAQVKGPHDALVILAKPQTFMNRSGLALSKLARHYQVESDHIIVLADELDLPIGEVRTKFGGGHAGHNGHRSIIDELGTRDYHRVRIGIGRPPGKQDPADYVLERLRTSALEELQTNCEVAAHKALELIAND